MSSLKNPLLSNIEFCTHTSVNIIRDNGLSMQFENFNVTYNLFRQFSVIYIISIEEISSQFFISRTDKAAIPLDIKC